MADTFAKYHCNYCEDDVNGLRVRCLECDDFDLCLQCFACGAEIGKHRANHGYQFMAGVFQDTGNFSIFPGPRNWTAREEVRLLDAIEQFGYGNWEDIAGHIETRTPSETREKYIGSYIEGHVGQASWKPAQDNLSLPIEHTITDTGPLSPSLGSSLPTQPIPTEETVAIGFMPHRDDFEREWENEAENIVSSLFLHPVDDEDIDIALKLSQVDMYIRRLRERARRKRVVKDFNLVSQFFKKEKERQLPNPPKKKHKEDKEALSEKLRPISQFQTASEHQNLVNSMAKEKELKLRIRELLRYRRNGIRHIEECHEFEIARARRDKKKENRKKSASLPQTPTLMDQCASSRENGERSPKCLVGGKYTVPDTGVGRWPSGNYNDTNAWTGNSSSPVNQILAGQSQQSTDDPVPVSSLPGYHLLSTRERKLCSSMNLKPSQYIAYKAILLKEEGERQGSSGGNSSFNSVLRGTPLHCSPTGLDQHTQVVISNFLTRAGWISSCS